MLSRRSLIASAVTATATAGSSFGSGDSSRGETLSMLNGQFWTEASPAERLFCVRAAHEAVTAYVDEATPKGAVGWTYQQMVSWIDALYARTPENSVLPVAIAYGFSRRSSHGADATAIAGELDAMVKRLRS